MELLIEILLSVLPEDWGARDLRFLASVCRSWRNIILNTPRFWRVIDSRQVLHSWSQVLQRNKAGSLDVLIRGREVPWGDPQRIRRLIEFITPESQRISSIQFDDYYKSTYIQEFFKNVSLPSMDALSATTWPQPSVPMHIQVGDGIPLRYLHLVSVTVPWDTPRLSGLKVLTLWNLESNYPTSSQLYHILSSAPFLERFSFSHWKPGPNAEYPDSQKLAPIKLPLLKSVGVHQIPQSINALLLAMLETPVLEDVVWTDLHGLESGYNLLRWSSMGIKTFPELVVRWYSWVQTLEIKSRGWKKTSTPQLLSRRPVELSIRNIQNPSELIEELAKLLTKSNSVVLETDSTEVATRARRAFEHSGADLSIPILAS